MEWGFGGVRSGYLEMAWERKGTLTFKLENKLLTFVKGNT